MIALGGNGEVSGVSRRCLLAWPLVGLPILMVPPWAGGVRTASARADTARRGPRGGASRRDFSDPVESSLHRRERPLLTETVGLLMQYAALAGDRRIFDEQLSRVRHHLQSPCGLLSWRATPDLQVVAPSSASIDDLTVVRALLLAADRWSLDEARQLAGSISEAVLRYEVLEGQLVDAASWDDEEVVPSDRIQTAYLALDVMARLAQGTPAWAQVHEQSVALLLALETPHGLFPEEIPLPGEGPSALASAGDPVVNAILVLYCALHLALVGRGGERTLSLVRAQWRQHGVLAGRYHLASSAPVAGYESVAVYGLAARLARTIGDHALADELLTRLLCFQYLHPVTAVPSGPLPHRDTSPFDNLQALLALQQTPSWSMP